MKHPRILIACIGNIFLGDDGFGSEVARRMASRTLPNNVVLKDFGIRGFDLTYALLEPYDLVVLVDACARGGQPGTLYLIEPDPVEASQSIATGLEGHSLNPTNVLRAARMMGGTPGRIVILGCEPATLGSDEEGTIGLSEPVAAAVEETLGMIETLISNAQSGQPVESALSTK